MSGQVLIVDPARNDILYNPVQTGLLERGHKVMRYPSFDQFLSDRRALETADILFALGVSIKRDVMAQMPRLRAVMSPVTGTDGIDEAAATDLGIIVGNGQIPENSESMAEATVMLMLACLYDLHGSEEVLRKDQPHPMPVRAQMAKGKLFGLIGFGQIARAIVRRLEGWNVRIQTYAPRLRSPLPAHVERVELEHLLRTSDVVSVLCPLNDETRGMLNAERLAMLKPGAIFVNTARGKIADEAALYELVRKKHVRRIASDVFDIEPPPPGSILRQLPNRDAILTPHLVGHTAEVIDALPKASLDSVERIMAGEPPLYVRNPEVLPRWNQRWGPGHAAT
ncbi:MAG: NAD(P)-dependent oxidoreductase [Candidatus Binatus sp.]|uniref:NAD(P)-dependent oxidoreductase n=1 Tax=Candidatus Binatus sp. TaxID=2811406 RepID=UPI002726BBDD|nr:NAD(P)-dependent oxidoreductase [Candidatus Binatus sp.]MDO8434661.1 NAD(P)-dependent oxidoreductase [Candidatus Binatus sp.]